MTSQEDPFSDHDDPSSHPLAPDHVQRDVAAMLRHAARDDVGSEARMPADVEANIRAALRAESRGGADAGPRSTPSTVVPLPRVNRPKVQRESVKTTPTRENPVHEAPRAPQAGSHPQNGVTSLTERRKRKSGTARVAMVLGAAAAVALGSLGVWKATNGTDDHGSTSVASPTIRVTNSQTAYTPERWESQAASMTTSTSAPVVTSMAQAQRDHLGRLSNKQDLKACVNAIDTAVEGHPDMVYADFGTYEGVKSVIVVVVKGDRKTAWAVNRTCSTLSDVKAGPSTIAT